ncbi:MAG TPA: F0F1 ATP synthase subunit B [Salinisphaeraceae bacterium]|nr:F0F1 ATP synthase subunit B [Salinisphaeraceae bacterium]
MSINITLFAQVVVFALLVWFTMKFIWPPVTKALRERQQRISDGLAAADRGERELEEASAKVDEMLQEARTQANEILANARKQSSEAVEQAREDARAEGERIVAAAREEVEQTVAQARAELQEEVGRLAVSGAERILKREIDAKAHNDIIDELVAEVG